MPLRPQAVFQLEYRLRVQIYSVFVYMVSEKSVSASENYPQWHIGLFKHDLLR